MKKARLRILSPCDVPWTSMSKVSDRARHCSSCDRDVHDLRGMTEKQVSSFLSGFSELPCVRFNPDKDGRIVYARSMSRPAALAAAASLVISACGGANESTATTTVANTSGCDCDGHHQSDESGNGPVVVQQDPPGADSRPTDNEPYPVHQYDQPTAGVPVMDHGND